MARRPRDGVVSENLGRARSRLPGERQLSVPCPRSIVLVVIPTAVKKISSRRCGRVQRHSLPRAFVSLTLRQRRRGYRGPGSAFVARQSSRRTAAASARSRRGGGADGSQAREHLSVGDCVGGFIFPRFPPAFNGPVRDRALLGACRLKRPDQVPTRHPVTSRPAGVRRGSKGHLRIRAAPQPRRPSYRCVNHQTWRVIPSAGRTASLTCTPMRSTRVRVELVH